jgi:drug/metabolite transporter (DMT)-like permease
MTTGILAALGAGILWGFVFVAPVIAHQHAPWTLALARYTVFGVASLIIYVTLIPAAQKQVLSQHGSVWRTGLWLSLVGNLLYYIALAFGIQKIGVTLVSLVIGTLPIVVSLIANFTERTVPWHKLALPLGLIFVGFLLAQEGESAARNVSTQDFALGMLGAVGALVAWTIYPIYNARFIRAYPRIEMTTWACVQGVALLPVVASLLLCTHFFGPAVTRIDAGDPARLWLAVLVTGIFSSWVGTLLWNVASQRLPAALTGQLIVFETIFSLLYGFLYDQRWPTLSVLAGMGVLIVGVMVGVRTFQSTLR